MSKIFYGRHHIDDDDIAAVTEILKNHSLTQGHTVDLFEQEVADFVGAKYAVAMSSWTAGLHMACLAAGISPNDKVITSPITFVASSNAALYCGAEPVFVDINPETVNIDSELLKISVKENNAKAIIPVHYAGLSCNMDEIFAISQDSGSIVIEDAAHALGARYHDGSMVGNCKYSLMTGFSFHPVKSIACGEGGMITTNDKNIYNKLLRLRSHGINKNDDTLSNLDLAYTKNLLNPWYYEMQELGYNYRITDIQCALGRSQLKKLPKFLEKRKHLAKIYDEAFADLRNAKPIHINYRNFSSHHLYVLKIDFEASGLSRAELMHALQEENIFTQVHYIPVTSHHYYKQLGYDTANYPNALKFYDQALSIPLYYDLTNADQEKVINIIRRFIS